MTESVTPVWVGTCGWSKPAWRGTFYDDTVKQREQLKFASKYLKSLEINSTFHGLKEPKDFLSWRAQTPDGFMFSIKGHREVTHEQALRNPERNVAAFFASGVPLLDDKFGPVLWQISEHYAYNPEVVDRFLAALPQTVAEARVLIRQNTAGAKIDRRILELPNRRIRHAFEVRHPSFDNPRFIEQLRRHDVAAVMTNSPEWPEIRELTSDFVYLRFHGDVRRNPDGYDDATLAEWSEQIDGWRSGRTAPDRQPREVYVYFDNPEGGGASSPFTARRLQQLVDGDDGVEPMPVQPSLF
ncbi:MAG: DUF72 domain-containing protein [Cryobacterium sp.]|nr:DUF72 domain-containing protein [Cryobacterium sp.]